MNSYKLSKRWQMSALVSAIRKMSGAASFCTSKRIVTVLQEESYCHPAPHKSCLLPRLAKRLEPSRDINHSFRIKFLKCLNSNQSRKPSFPLQRWHWNSCTIQKVNFKLLWLPGPWKPGGWGLRTKRLLLSDFSGHCNSLSFENHGSFSICAFFSFVSLPFFLPSFLPAFLWFSVLGFELRVPVARQVLYHLSYAPSPSHIGQAWIEGLSKINWPVALKTVNSTLGKNGLRNFR
jgi:hypothetical protein